VVRAFVPSNHFNSCVNGCLGRTARRRLEIEPDRQHENLKERQEDSVQLWTAPVKPKPGLSGPPAVLSFNVFGA
jgi:hypothetical protein